MIFPSCARRVAEYLRDTNASINRRDFLKHTVVIGAGFVAGRALTAAGTFPEHEQKTGATLCVAPAGCYANLFCGQTFSGTVNGAR
jgi:hypothetical protein